MIILNDDSISRDNSIVYKSLTTKSQLLWWYSARNLFADTRIYLQCNDAIYLK